MENLQNRIESVRKRMVLMHSSLSHLLSMITNEYPRINISEKGDVLRVTSSSHSTFKTSAAIGGYDSLPIPVGKMNLRFDCLEAFIILGFIGKPKPNCEFIWEIHWRPENQLLQLKITPNQRKLERFEFVLNEETIHLLSINEENRRTAAVISDILKRIDDYLKDYSLGRLSERIDATIKAIGNQVQESQHVRADKMEKMITMLNEEE